MSITREDIIQNGRQTIDIESSIGILKFRKLFANDERLLFKYKNEDDEKYCKYFILNQLKAPELKMDVLNTLNQKEISGIIMEYLNKSNLTKYFKFENQFYKDFKEGMINYITSQVKSTQELMKKLAMPNAMKNFMENNVPITANSSYMGEFAQNLMNIIAPQQKAWEEWAKQNEKIQEIHERTQKYWDDALKEFQMSKKEAFDNLENYHWIISPNMDSQIVYDVIRIFKSDSQHKLKEINGLFNNYFFDNDCERLYGLLEIWGQKPRFNDNRIKIIRNCIDTIRLMPDGFNFSDVIVPTLIAQTEGVQFGFMEENFTIDKKNRLWVNNTKLVDQNGSNIYFDDYWEQLISGDEFLEAMNYLFLEILFQKTYYGQPYSKSIHFSRNKILHGENTNYGYKTYTSRCFLILDFLSELSHE